MCAIGLKKLFGNEIGEDGWEEEEVEVDERYRDLGVS